MSHFRDMRRLPRLCADKQGSLKTVIPLLFLSSASSFASRSASCCFRTYAAVCAVLLASFTCQSALAFAWGPPMSSSHSLLGSQISRPPFHTTRSLVHDYHSRRMLVWQSSESLDFHKEKVYGMHDSFEGRAASSTVWEKDSAEEEKRRASHNEKQASVFDEAAQFFSSEEATPEDVIPRLRRIAEAAALRPTDRVLDVGTGTGALLPFLLPYLDENAGEKRIVGMDLSAGMLVVARERFPRASFWQGDVLDLPVIYEREGGKEEGLFTAVFFNACFGNVFDQARALREVGKLVKKGGRVVISHPLGADFVEELRRRSPSVVLADLPRDEKAWRDILVTTPFQLTSLQSTSSLYLALLCRRPDQPLPQALLLQGPVSQGYKRGSKKLGFPTANLPSSLFVVKSLIEDIPVGVYCGWARVVGRECKAVVNIGYSPTFQGEENREKIVEAHLIDGAFPGDFYGELMTLILTGFLRPEQKFPSFPALVAAIQQDVEDARVAMDLPVYAGAKRLVEEEGEGTGEEERGNGASKGKGRWVPFEEWGPR